METKSLQNILKEKNYQVRGKEERKKLSLACAEYLNQDDKAIWYHGLVKEISPHILELYNQRKFPKSAFGRDSIQRSIPKKIEEYLYKNPENVLSEKDLLEKVSKEYLENFGKGTARSELKASRKENSKLFEIKNIYGVLRDFYKLEKEDKLEINIPTHLFNQKNFLETFEKAKEFEKNTYEKKSYNDKGFFEEFYEKEIKNVDKDKINVREDSHMASSEKTFQNLFASEYLLRVSKIPLAYNSPKKAIKFFETETGISLKKPKEHRKLVF